MCNIECELPKLTKISTPIARKEHICCECGSLILPGEKYERYTGLWDGGFETYKTCIFCADVRNTAQYDFGLRFDEGFPFGGLWECVGYDFTQKTKEVIK